MPSIKYDDKGEIIEINEHDGDTTEYVQGQGVSVTRGSIGDPNAPVDYSDQELADALPFTQAAGSPEQKELDGMRARINFCQAKADKVSGYSADGTPRYEVGDAERSSLLNTVKNLTNGLELQLLMSQRSIARRYLDSQKKVADAQAELAHHAALEQRARELAFEQDAKDLADLFTKRRIGK